METTGHVTIIFIFKLTYQPDLQAISTHESCRRSSRYGLIVATACRVLFYIKIPLFESFCPSSDFSVFETWQRVHALTLATVSVDDLICSNFICMYHKLITSCVIPVYDSMRNICKPLKFLIHEESTMNYDKLSM